MWGPAPLIAIAVLLGASVVFLFSGLVIVGIPMLLVGFGVIAAVEVSRRRHRVQDVQEFREQSKTEKIDFTERDRETLAN